MCVINSTDAYVWGSQSPQATAGARISGLKELSRG